MDKSSQPWFVETPPVFITGFTDIKKFNALLASSDLDKYERKAYQH